MKPYIESSYQTIGLNGRMFSSVAGHLIRRPLRPVTSIAVSIYYRELASLRYLSPLHLERQDLSEPVALQKEAFIIPEKSGLKRRGLRCTHSTGPAPKSTSPKEGRRLTAREGEVIH